MFTTVSTHAFLYEPVDDWQDGRNACLDRLVPAAHFATLPAYLPHPGGRALPDELKRGLMDPFHRHGAVHLQIGKADRHLREREPTPVRTILKPKHVLDPHGRLNPGAPGR